MKQFFAPILLLILLLPSSSLAKSENVSVQLQCDGLVTIYNDDRLKVSKPLEIPNTGISIEIREKTVLVAGSLGWDGKFGRKRDENFWESGQGRVGCYRAEGAFSDWPLSLLS